MNLDLLTIDAARSAVQERKATAVALAESFYAKIESDDPQDWRFSDAVERAGYDQGGGDGRACGQRRKAFRHWAACRLESKT